MQFFNGTTESASYTYDLEKRLVTSNQTTNGASAQRKFGYDRWGNRTTVWPSVSGGSPIQTVTLEQSGGAPTNRITSVTNSGVTANYTYDAVGNVINDGVHSYAYDAANRMVSVDNGSTAQYKYDYQNRRVTKIVGSSWTHYVWEGSQVIGEHDATTAYTTNPSYQVKSARLDYVYARGRLITSKQYTWTQQCTTNKYGQTTCTWVVGTVQNYYLSDLWSTRLVLDTSGNVLGRQAHLPFGEEFAESGTQEKHHFTTYEAESESSTDYAVNRQYSQTVGRFGSADPYQASSYLVNPQSWNRYSYVENDPIHNVDPLGLFLGYPGPEPDPCCSGSGCGDPGPPAPTASCSIGVNFTGPLSPADTLSFDWLSSRESRQTGPTDMGPSPFGPGWYYRVEVFGTVPGDVSTWRIRQEVQSYFFVEYEDGSTFGPTRDNVFRPDDYRLSRTQMPSGQDSFFAIDAPGQSIIRDGKKIRSMTLYMNFYTWAEFNVQGLGRVCWPTAWHVKIVIQNGEIKKFSGGSGHLNI